MIEIGEFVDAQGGSPFGRWVSRLDRHAAARVATALYRMEMENLSNAKGVGGGVLEYRIDFGPGYRIYFGQDGDALIILLGGGTKSAPAARYRGCGGGVAGVQAEQAAGGLRLCH